MTVWVYTTQSGSFTQAATVENGKVTSGDETLVSAAFPDGIPEDETEVAKMFDSPPTISATDFEVDWEPEQSLDTMSTTDPLQADFSEGDIVTTPEGDGVVVGVWEQSWEDDGESVEASEDSPAYTVALVDGGYSHFSAGEVSEGDFPEIEDVDDPVRDIQASSDVMSAIDADIDTLDWTMPDSWRESSKPARLILLDAWASMGGQFDCGGACCMGELRDRELCASMKDEVIGSTAWRGWGPD